MNSSSLRTLPKITLSFKLVSAPTKKIIIQTPQNSEFIKLIPDKISKQVTRLKRQDEETHSDAVEMKDGSSVKTMSLLNLSESKNARIKKKSLTVKNDYIYRKLRLSSSIHEELTTFFSSCYCPGLLKFDKGLWLISQVRNAFIYFAF